MVSRDAVVYPCKTRPCKDLDGRAILWVGLTGYWDICKFNRSLLTYVSRSHKLVVLPFKCPGRKLLPSIVSVSCVPPQSTVRVRPYRNLSRAYCSQPSNVPRK